MNRSIKFLSTFDPDPATVQQPPANAPQQGTPAVVINLGDAYAARDAARAQQAAVQQQSAPPQQQQQPPPPQVQPPADPTRAELEQLRTTVSQLGTQIQQLTGNLQASALENYRLQVIQSVRASGRELLDAMVGGRTPQEIDASVTVAIAEYNLLEQQFRSKFGQAPPPGQQPGQPPVGTVQQQGITPQPQPPPQQQQPPPPGALSLPGFYSAPGAPPEQQQGISQEVLAYLTSGDAIRNGDYAKNRHMIHGALRHSAGTPGTQAWSFGAGSQPGLAPPPPPQQYQPGAVQHPSFAPMGPVQTQPTHFQTPQAYQPQSVQPGAGFAPQPAQFQADHGNGQYSPNGAQPSNQQLSSAREAAQRSLQSGGRPAVPTVGGFAR